MLSLKIGGIFMEIIESAESIQLDDFNKYFLDEMIGKYQEYLVEIQEFNERTLEHYLNTIKQHEKINNHRTESENPFFITFYSQTLKEDSLTHLITLLNEDPKLSSEDIKVLHKILMEGTDSEFGSDDYRKNDTKFVGAFNPDGSKRIDYIPIPSEVVEESMDRVLELLNDDNIENPFINPFIVHGLIAVMQPFDDGNTRTARLLQHGKIWTSTNSLYFTSFNKPTLYLSENYLISKKQYRELINSLAIQKNNPAWNSWIKYNLFKVDEQLNYLGGNVAKLKMRLR